jgi:hypothetical protein
VPKLFKGKTAVARSASFFEKIKLDPNAFEIWLVRCDGRPNAFVVRKRRNHKNEWVDIPFATDTKFPDKN